MWAPLLQQVFVAQPEVQIVLSTSWARWLSFTRARRALPVPLQPRVIGATWHSAMGRSALPCWWDDSSRYQQIRRWVNRCPAAQWLAVDDDDEGWPPAERHHLVKTDGMAGLGDGASLLSLVRALDTMQAAIEPLDSADQDHRSESK